MIIKDSQMISITDANKNFSNVAKLATQQQCAIILKNNKPKYILLDIDKLPASIRELDFDATDTTTLYLRKDSWV